MHGQHAINNFLPHRASKTLGNTLIIALIVLVTMGAWGCRDSSGPETNPTQITLKLGGNDCEFYLGAVDTALKKLKGVRTTDLSTQKGYAIIKTDGTLKASQVVDAVDGLSGEGWSCEAELKS